MTDKTKEAIAKVLDRVRNFKDGTPKQALAKICAIVEAEQSTPTEDEFEKWLSRHVEDSKQYPAENDGHAMLKMCLHKYRTLRPTPTAPPHDGQGQGGQVI